MTNDEEILKRCTEWHGEHAAVFDHGVNFIDRLARYEDTGLTPDQILALRAQQGAENDEPRYAERVRVFDDPWTGRRMTTCSWCQGKVGPHDRFCKHCGREFRERSVEAIEEKGGQHG